MEKQGEGLQSNIVGYEVTMYVIWKPKHNICLHFTTSFNLCLFW